MTNNYTHMMKEEFESAILRDLYYCNPFADIYFTIANCNNNAALIIFYLNEPSSFLKNIKLYLYSDIISILHDFPSINQHVQIFSDFASHELHEDTFLASKGFMVFEIGPDKFKNIDWCLISSPITKIKYNELPSSFKTPAVLVVDLLDFENNSLLVVPSQIFE